MNSEKLSPWVVFPYLLFISTFCTIYGERLIAYLIDINKGIYQCEILI